MKNFLKVLPLFFGLFFALFTLAQDNTPPTGSISAPAAAKVGEVFNITVSGEDDTQMRFICYKEENDEDWICHDCAQTATSCSFSFERKELEIKKHKYYGLLKDADDNTSFTDPNNVEVKIEKVPIVSTISVYLNYERTSAILEGYLNDLGGAEKVEVWFEWGTTTDYGNETPKKSIKSSGSFTANITGLDPTEIYHFRAVAKNDVGTDYGDDMLSTELIKNGNFETGKLSFGWKTIGLFGLKTVSDEDVHQGLYSGLIGFKEGENKKDAKSGIYQEFTIPSTAGNVKLSLWYKFYTNDKCNYDFLNIYLKDIKGRILKTYLEWCCQNCLGLNTYGWNQITDDLSGFAGKTVIIWFEVENRSDSSRRSWAFIDEVSVTYTPLTRPSVTTREATAIETASAVLNGELVDMGRADSVEVWFVWDYVSHNNWKDYSNKTDSLFLNSTGSFAISLGNLNSGTTYYFRAVAKNEAEISSGADLKFTTKYSAEGGWISPNGHEDPEGKWVDEEKAYDAPYAPNYLETYAENSRGPNCRSAVGPGWGGYIVFTLPEPVRSNKVRINADYLDIHIKEVEIDVLKDGTWINVHKGAIANCAWQEIPFSEGMVTKARFRYNYKTDRWCYWVYEFQFYKVPDEPITPPAGITLDATSIEKKSAILHGQVIDDGRELCEVRFQYGENLDLENYGKNTPWMKGPGGVGFASGETFGKFISDLEEGKTYYFRAQIKNNASTTSGAIKSFFTQPALSGWVSPQGFIDPEGKWENEEYAFDDETWTYARSYRNIGEGVWSPYIYLTHEEIYSDRVRFWARELIEVDLVEIGILKEGTWLTVYNGPFPDYQWKEISFPGGRVSQARIRFHARYSNHYFYYHLYEFDFWKISQAPSAITKDAIDIKENEAKLRGKITDLGGAHSSEVWFVWDKVYHDNWKDYASSTQKITLTQIGEVEELITGLDPNREYHFRVVASNVAGTSQGEDRIFTTLGVCSPGETQECTSEQGCPHTIECPETGYWPPCPRDECCKLEECLEDGRSPECPCPEPPEGYQSPEYGFCKEDCTCATGTGPGEPCEPWPINQPPAKPQNLYETWDDCSFKGLSIPTFYWDYFDQNGDPQAGYQIKIYGEETLDLTSDISSTIFTPDQNWVANNLLFGEKTYSWQVRVKDNQGNWSDWSDLKNFKTKKHPCPWVSFNWIPQKPNLGQVVQFCSIYEENVCTREPEKGWSECFTPSCIWSWSFENGQPSSSSKENPTSTFPTTVTSTIILMIKDSDNCLCSLSKEFQQNYPLPKWKEIPP